MAHPLFRAETQFGQATISTEFVGLKWRCKEIKFYRNPHTRLWNVPICISGVPHHLYQSVLLQSPFVTPDIGTVPEFIQVKIH